MAIHEFRTPLSTMLVIADSMETYWEKISKQKMLVKINRFKKNITFLTRVMEQVLNLSMIELGKMKFKPEVLDLNKFLQLIPRDRRHVHVTKCGHRSRDLRRRQQRRESVRLIISGESVGCSNAGSFDFTPLESVASTRQRSISPGVSWSRGISALKLPSCCCIGSSASSPNMTR